MPRWQSTTPRRYKLPPDWPAIRTRVLARDGYRCAWTEHDQRCGRVATDVDHIEAGDDHSLSNLRALCRGHHAQKSSSEGGTASAKKRARRERPNERHPGLAASDGA